MNIRKKIYPAVAALLEAAVLAGCGSSGSSLEIVGAPEDGTYAQVSTTEPPAAESEIDSSEESTDTSADESKADVPVEVKPGYSGPIVASLDDEPEAIRNAPAYDTESAKTYFDLMPKIRELANSVDDNFKLASFGSSTPSSESLKKLENEIYKLSANGHKVSLIMADLKTCSGVAYSSTRKMCTQSTIKSVYVGSVLEGFVNCVAENGAFMRNTIEFSDNDSYGKLRDIYGDENFKKWCTETGVDTSFADDYYPRNGSAKDLFKLWTKLYCVLNDEGLSTGFARYYADSANSAAKEQLGDRYPVQTKAGWENGRDPDKPYDPNEAVDADYTDGDPSNDECAMNDSGIVYTEKGPYIFVIFTDISFVDMKDHKDDNPLLDITEALHDVQASL